MARCSNCKAPLPSGSVLCEYCGNRTDIDLKGIHYYTTHESDTPRICPRCNIKLKTVDIKLDGRFLIDRCEECLGIFFDNGELEAVLDASVKNAIEINHLGLKAINAKREPNQYPVTYIKCPICSQLMNRLNYGAQSGVIIDRCYQHGIWLDGGELRQLMEWTRLGGPLLEQKRQEERRRAEEQRLRDEKEKLKGWDDESQSPLADLFMKHRKPKPGLLDLIIKVAKLLNKPV